MKDNSCTTEDGLQACNSSTTNDKSCGCSSSQQNSGKVNLEPKKSNTIQSALLLGVACLTSPCCVPLIVPIILGVLAGTPLAIWLTANVGWLYGGLTLISAVSFFLVWRLANQKSQSVQSPRFWLVSEIQKCLKPLNKFVRNRISR